jgi:ubiquinone/menaquinone biosynthesis C-methylase UbiE
VADAVDTLRRGLDAEKWRHSVRVSYEQQAERRRKSGQRYYYKKLISRLRHVVPPGARVLDIGCAEGHMLSALRPAYGVGIDFVEGHVRRARALHPQLRFEHMRAEDVDQLDETFDYIIISQTLSEIYDVVALLRGLLALCHDRTRLVIVSCSQLWQPAVRLAEWLGIMVKSPRQNWLPDDEIENLLTLAGWDVVRQCGATIAPLPAPLISDFLNRYVANLPIAGALCLNNILVARPVAAKVLKREPIESISVVIPARNEAGHIPELLARLPNLAPRQEVVFVEGNSTDDTWQVICETVANYEGPWTLRCAQQDGAGKGDAVRKAFDMCTGDVLMILDADISVPPEELLAFRDALGAGHAELVNGSRMVYLMDKKAMRFLNLLGNKFFGAVFTYLLSQRFRDTLCGTKVLRRADYLEIAANRAYFGEFDPFGDYDLLFGAARLNLKIVDVPVHYKARTYGVTNISRFRHGLILLKMCALAARKIKFV